MIVLWQDFRNAIVVHAICQLFLSTKKEYHLSQNACSIYICVSCGHIVTLPVYNRGPHSRVLQCCHSGRPRMDPRQYVTPCHIIQTQGRPAVVISFNDTHTDIHTHIHTHTHTHTYIIYISFYHLWLHIWIEQICQKRTHMNGSVVSVSSSHAVGHGFASRPGHTKDHHNNSYKLLPR